MQAFGDAREGQVADVARRATYAAVEGGAREA
jgi:hypothetical protein